MTIFPRAVAAALVISAAAGCRGERRCNEGTVLLTVTLAGKAGTADEIEIRPSVEGHFLAGGPVSRRAGETSGTIEVVLGDRYQTDAVVTIVVIARANGMVLAEGQVVERLEAVCSRLSITLGLTADGGPGDAAPAFDAGTPPADTMMPVPDAPPGADLAPVTDAPPSDAITPDLPPDRAPDVAPDLAPDTAPPITPRHIFVTRDAYTGSFGRLTGAHALCTQLANAAGLTGAYKAWLSTAVAGPESFMTHNPGPYILPDGQMVARDWDDLVDGSLLRPIDRDQNGQFAQTPGVCEGGEVWTNTTAAGTPIGPADCAGWTSQAIDIALASAAGNLHEANARWTNSGCVSIGCNSTLPIYCVEQ